MYANPVLLPETSNREDLLLTVSLFDDYTGAPLDLARRTLANAGDFTGNAWTVTIGSIVTASNSQITITDYPIGNETLALALTVGTDLAIDIGDPVVIADPTGNNSLTGYVTSYAPATGALICQIACALQFEIRPQQAGHGSGYGSSSMIGADACAGPVIAAQLGNGITLVDLGVAQVRIPEVLMQKLRHRTYSAFMALYDGADTRQLFVGKLPIISGGLSVASFQVQPSNPYGLP